MKREFEYSAVRYLYTSTPVQPFHITTVPQIVLEVLRCNTLYHDFGPCTQYQPDVLNIPFDWRKNFKSVSGDCKETT